MSPMLCPKCSQILHIATTETVNIHQCPSCDGQLFEKGELNTILQASIESNLNLYIQAPHKETILSCPSCQQNMKKHEIFNTSNLLIDVCHSCCLIWLDQLEAEKIRTMTHLETVDLSTLRT